MISTLSQSYLWVLWKGVSQRSSIERERKRANIFSRKAPSVIFFKVIKIVVVLLMFKKMNMDSLLTDMINYFITM